MRIAGAATVLVAAAAFSVFIAAPALAGPPYETDDPEPTAYRNYEIYLFSEARIEQDRAEAIPLALEVNYGLFPNVQFSVSFPTAYIQDTGESHTGIGDGEIGLKYRFVGETATRPQISFYPSVTIASGPPRYDLGSGHGTLLLPIWAQKSYGKWTMFGGGGMLIDSTLPSKHTWVEGIAVTRDISDTTNIGFEVFHSGAQADTPAFTDMGFGWMHDLGAFHGLLFSAGVNVVGSPSYHLYGAYEWRLGPKR